MEVNEKRPTPGKWEGYYLYSSCNVQHQQYLTIYFPSGGIVGDGRDDVGKFLISGEYDPEKREAHWQKYYPTHRVHCRGFFENDAIWGVWHILNEGSGGFHIWPVDSNVRLLTD